jgi:hypothetical protein
MPEPIRTSSWQQSFGTIKSFMQKAIGQSMSFNDFQLLAQVEGLSYNRQRMNTDWRSVQGLYKFESQLHALNPNEAIPGRLVSDEFHTVNYNYLAAIQYTYTDPLTGEDVQGFRFIDSSELQTPNEYLQRAFDIYGADSPYRDPSARDFKLRYVIGRAE